MSWWLSLLVGVVTAVAGCLGTGLVAAFLVDWFRVTSHEGAAGYFVVGLALLGLLGGLVVGVVSSRLVAASAHPGLVKALGVSLAATAAFLTLVVVLSWLSADFPPTLDGRELIVEVEVRLPAGLEPPAPGSVPEHEWHATITADSGRRHGSLAPLRLAEATRVDGAWILPAAVFLTTSDAGKALGAQLGEAGTQFFRMSVPGRPSHAAMDWSPWQTGATTGSLRPVPESEAASVRYRVQYLVEPAPEPPGPSHAELQAEIEAEKTAAFAALTPADPAEAWLRFADPGEPLDRRTEAAAALARRTEAGAELSALILSPDLETSDRALRAVALMDPPPAGLGPAILEVGRQIAEQIRTVNSTPVDADPSYELAAAASVRFAGWSEAARTVHGLDGLDLRPLMQELRDLAGVRDESVTMQDVVRISGYYAESLGRPPRE